MKTALFLVAAAVAAIGVGTPAQAQDYPWCAHYSGSDGAKNCGFVSFQQCLEDVRGIGGFCQQNPTFGTQRHYFNQ